MNVRWSYFPRNRRAPAWATDLVSVVAGVSDLANHQSNAVLAKLADGLVAAGYTIEKGKAKADKLPRPVLFGEGGHADVTMEIDAFHELHGVALEVEAGRAWNGNAVYRDIVRTSLLLDARHLALIVPLGYKPESAKAPIPAYAYTRDLLDAIYASGRLGLPFEGVLLVGY